jgi:hypothetical protein
LDPEKLSCKASVCGFDRVKRDRLILSELDQMKFSKENEYKVSFTQLLVKYSSHLNGQKLSIRFTLLDSNGKPISFIDSYEFETITKRGKGKKKQFFTLSLESKPNSFLTQFQRTSGKRKKKKIRR